MGGKRRRLEPIKKQLRDLSNARSNDHAVQPRSDCLPTWRAAVLAAWYGQRYCQGDRARDRRQLHAIQGAEVFSQGWASLKERAPRFQRRSSRESPSSSSIAGRDRSNRTADSRRAQPACGPTSCWRSGRHKDPLSQVIVIGATNRASLRSGGLATRRFGVHSSWVLRPIRTEPRFCASTEERHLVRSRIWKS